jgi:hypothetical protein
MIEFEKNQDRFMKKAHKPTTATTSPVRVVIKQKKKKQNVKPKKPNTGHLNLQEYALNNIT